MSLMGPGLAISVEKVGFLDQKVGMRRQKSDKFYSDWKIRLVIRNLFAHQVIIHNVAIADIKFSGSLIGKSQL